MDRTKTKKVKKLIMGGWIHPTFRGKILVAVPTNRNVGFVEFKRERMKLPEKSLMVIGEFPDKFGGEPYSLAYYEWKPDKKQMELF